MDIPHTPGVIVRYKRPTNSRGSRVFLELPDRGLSKKTISFDYAESSIYVMAANALVKAGFEVKGVTDGNDAYVVMVGWKCTDDSNTLDKLWAKVGK
jgi:hypothetical protein